MIKNANQHNILPFRLSACACVHMRILDPEHGWSLTYAMWPFCQMKYISNPSRDCFRIV